MADYDALLTVCFGTAAPEQFLNCFGAVHRKACRLAGEGGLERLAVTSPRIRAALEQKEIAVLSPEKALKQLAEEGCRRVLVLTLLMTDGEEWERLRETCDAARQWFDQLTLTPPVLTRNAEGTAHLLNRWYPRTQGSGIVLLGHGGGDGWPYRRLQEALKEQGREDIFVMLLHGAPGPREAEACMTALGVRRLTLGFLMITAGHHARQAAENPDGPGAFFCRKGFEVNICLKGLGEIPDFCRLAIPEILWERSEALV